MERDDDALPRLADMVGLERCVPARNMARFYVLTVEKDLFGETQLLRQWGRIGRRGREMRRHYPSPALAHEALGRWLAHKLKRGYERIG